MSAIKSVMVIVSAENGYNEAILTLNDGKLSLIGDVNYAAEALDALEAARTGKQPESEGAV